MAFLRSGRFLEQFALDIGAVLVEHGLVEWECLRAMRAGDQGVGGVGHGAGKAMAAGEAIRRRSAEVGNFNR